MPRASFPDGRWWVPLAALRDPATAAGRHRPGARPATRGRRLPAIGQHLAGRRVLLILDNAEHLLPEPCRCGGGARRPPAGGSTVLLTSREPLRLQAERLVRVPVMTRGGRRTAPHVRAAIARGESSGRRRRSSSLARRLDRLPLALQPGRCAPADPVRRADPGAPVAASRPLRRQPATRTRGSGRCAPRSNGATTSSPSRSARSSGGCRSSPAVGRSRPPKPSATRRSTSSRLWWTARWSSAAMTQARSRASSMLDSIGQFADRAPCRVGRGARQSAPVTRPGSAIWRSASTSSLRAGEPEEQWVTLLNPELDNLRAAVPSAWRLATRELVRAIAGGLPMFWVMHGRFGRGPRVDRTGARARPDRGRHPSAPPLAASPSSPTCRATTPPPPSRPMTRPRSSPQARPGGRPLRRPPSADRLAAMMHDDFATAEPLYEELLVVGPRRRQRGRHVGLPHQ